MTRAATTRQTNLELVITFLEAEARERSINVFLSSAARTRVIHMARLIVPKEARGTGVGSLWMDVLTTMADAAEATVTLDPSVDYGASSRARLVAFYRRFGFVENRGRTRDDALFAAMYRRPRKL